MKPVNINDIEELEPVELFGKFCLLSYKRIEDSSVPEGLFKYDLRHGDDFGIPCEVCNKVVCNYFGSIITDEKIPVDLNKFSLSIKCDDDNYDFDPFEAKGLEDDELDLIPSMIEPYMEYDTGNYNIPNDRIISKEPETPNIIIHGRPKCVDNNILFLDTEGTLTQED
jgi:hypothetical protein